MVLFGRASFLTGVIAGQSQIMSAKVEVSPKLGGVKKKRHGHNFDFSDSPLNQRGPNMVGSTLRRKYFSLNILTVGDQPEVEFLNFDQN